MIGERFPAETKEIYKSFLIPNSVQRADTMCSVLWNGNPLSKELLAPLLDDRRMLPRDWNSCRVCDRAAQAISHTFQHVEFRSDWSVARKDQQIERIRQLSRSHIP